MIALLDISVLLALVDPGHKHHEQAHDWATREVDDGWATCAITQNGLVRILSQPKYPNHVTVGTARELLHALTEHPKHQFWECDLQLTSEGIRHDQLIGSRQITDTYLLALAISKQGRFVTLDRRVRVSAVAGASSEHLVVL
ncbi:MAG: hypothetical protein Q4D79_08130 [Propionibacteriaceae bacterium]|nr:hypothetical protein [Propionibacteriaceae bacterium]